MLNRDGYSLRMRHSFAMQEQVNKQTDLSLFHRTFFITIVSLTPTHALVLSYTKIT